MKIKTVNIDAGVEAVLRQAKLEGNNLVLQGQLMPKMYKDVMKILGAIGFKWNRSAGCHIGEGDSADKLREALGTGKVVNEKQTYQFFETPAVVACKLASLADIKRGHLVLEPSAGKGAIVRAIQDECKGVVNMHVCELNPKMAGNLAILAEESSKAGYGDIEVSCGDFLQVNRKYDRIVMNPPFNAGQDVDHVKHAYSLLLPGGRMVSIVSPSWLSNSSKKHTAFKKWFNDLIDEGQAFVAEELPEGTFKESGTNVSTIIIVLQKPLAKEDAA